MAAWYPYGGSVWIGVPSFALVALYGFTEPDAVDLLSPEVVAEVFEEVS